MDNLELRYNNVVFHEITDNIQKSFVSSIRHSIERALKPVKKEIESSDGFVRVNYREHKLEVTVFFLSEQLEQKIYRILN